MIYSKTELGQSALKTRSHGLTPRQRSALIMFDGARQVQDVFRATEGLGVNEEDVAHLVGLGLLAAAGGSTAQAPSTPAAAPTSISTSTSSSARLPQPAPKAASSADASAGAVAQQGAPPTQSAQDHYSKAYPIAARLTAGLGLRGFRLNLAVEGAGNLAELQALSLKIREAVGAEKYRELERALYD